MRNALEEGEHLSGRFQSIVNNSNEIPLFSNGSVHFSEFVYRNVLFFWDTLLIGHVGGVSLKKRTRKMQLRNIDLRSVRHSNKKLSPRIDFWDFHHVYPLEHLNPIPPPPRKLNQIEKSKLWINYKHKKEPKKTTRGRHRTPGKWDISWPTL